MTATIEVNKKSVLDLLSEGKEHTFLIPAYQRPYEWDEERIRTLVDDLWNFTVSPNGKTYFLGCIVTYENDDEQYEVIDGQQRITSLFLLLRAVYKKLENMESCDAVNNLKSTIEPALWYKDDITGKVTKNRIFIESRVIDSKNNEVFADILKTGEITKRRDLYSKNYRLFYDLLDDLSRDNPMQFYQFVNNILKNSVIFPINADSQDTALSIFTTLNDRGQQLTDADIFKSKIYQKISPDQKEVFIKRWNALSEKCVDCDRTVQQCFTNYMAYLRAKAGDKDTSTPSLRKFFTEDKDRRLSSPDLMDDLESIAKLWTVINRHEEIENECWSKNIRILKGLDILRSYPNELWVQPVVCYYLANKADDRFENVFELFIYKLISELMVKHFNDPRIPAVRFSILILNIESIKTLYPAFAFEETIDRDYICSKIEIPHYMIGRMLMKVIAYNHQDAILPEKWEIEHILPIHWQDSYFLNMTDEEINSYIEHIGNKIPFEKRLNIIASDGYFAAKKDQYAKSRIEIVRNLSKSPSNNWHIQDILSRDVLLFNEICDKLESWRQDYDDACKRIERQVDNPTEEDLRRIEEWKRRGLIRSSESEGVHQGLLRHHA